MRDERSIKIGIDPRVSSAPMKIPRINSRFHASINSRVSELALPFLRWNKIIIISLIIPEDAQKILKLLPPYPKRRDKLH